MKLSDLSKTTGGATEGKWFEFTFSDGSTQDLKIASSLTPEYQNFAAMRFNKARRGRQTIPAPVSRRIIIDGIVKILLKDWRGKGLTNDDGTPAEFNEQNVRTVIDNKSVDSQRCADFIIEMAGNLMNFTDEEAVADGETGDISDENREGKEPVSPADAIKSGNQVESGMGERVPIPAGH